MTLVISVKKSSLKGPLMKSLVIENAPGDFKQFAYTCMSTVFWGEMYLSILCILPYTIFWYEIAFSLLMCILL